MAQEPLKASSGETPAENPFPNIDFSKIRFCTQKIAPAVKVKLPDPLPQGNFIPHQRGDDPPLARLALPTRLLWPNGQNLRVKFLGGSSFVQGKVKQYAAAWTPFANISFEFVNSGPSEIRVGFTSGIGSWSYLGSSNLRIAADSPTMNFGWFDDNTPDDEFSRTIIHEFGHALGCVHEHQSPVASIPWNREAVYAYYRINDGWDRAQVDAQIFSVWGAAETKFSAFDAASIMEYPVPPELTTNGFSIGWNRVLSEGDKAFIREMYPKRIVNKNTFNTTEIRPWEQPQAQNPAQIDFVTPFAQAPNLAIGINSMDLWEGRNIRLNAFANQVLTTSFQLHLDCWADTRIYSAGATWLEAAQDDPDIQIGRWGTQDDHPWHQPQVATSANLPFPRPYAAPPNVVLWLHEVDMAHDKGWRVRSYTSDVTATGFGIHIDTWADTRLYSATAHWIAYPADKPHIATGSVTTGDFPSSKTHQGQVTFPAGTFAVPPRVMMAVGSMDFGSGKGLRFKIYPTDVSKDGFTWHIDSWADSIVNSVWANWIAVP